MNITASERAALEDLTDAQLRAITRENERKQRGGVPIPTLEQSEADHAALILKQRKGDEK